MKIFVCVDDEGGMSFMGRRVSRDRVVTEDIIKTAGGKLVIYPYSERLLREAGCSPRVSCDALAAAGDDEWVFIEDRGAGECLDRIDTVVLYRWNRLYPSDKKLDFCPTRAGFSLAEATDMVGKSHEKITREVYKR